MAIDPTRVPRFGHGSRVPGWDDAADLDKDPSGVPDPATTPVPQSLRERIEAHMAKYPDRRSAAIPALYEVQNDYGWCTPEGIEQAACVMRLTPGYLIAVATFYDMLFTHPVGQHHVYELYDAFLEEAGDDPRINLREFECLGACDIAPMVSIDGAYVGPVEIDEVPTVVQQIRDGVEVLPEKQLVRRKSVDPNARGQ
jgi:NADH-quinone oxidoreductase subunit E